MNLIVNRQLDRAEKQLIHELTLKKRQSKKSTMSEKQVAANQQLAKELMQERRKKEAANLKFNKTRLEHLNAELDRTLHEYEFLIGQEKALLNAHNFALFNEQGFNNFDLYDALSTPSRRIRTSQQQQHQRQQQHQQHQQQQPLHKLPSSSSIVRGNSDTSSASTISSRNSSNNTCCSSSSSSSSSSASSSSASESNQEAPQDPSRPGATLARSAQVAPKAPARLIAGPIKQPPPLTSSASTVSNLNNLSKLQSIIAAPRRSASSVALLTVSRNSQAID